MNNQRGIALIIVLAVVAILSVLVIEFSHSVWIDMYLSSNYDSRTQALYAAKAGVEYGIWLLRRDDETRVDWLGDEWAKPIELTIGDLVPPPDPELDEEDFYEQLALRRPHLVEPRTGVGTATVLIVDADRKLSLNMLDYKATPHPLFARAFERLIEDLNVPEVSYGASDIVDAMVDWVDRNEAGSWEYYYERLPDPYMAKNHHFDTVYELGLVAGISETLLFGTVPYPEREPGYDLDDEQLWWTSEDLLGPNDSYGLINFVHAQTVQRLNVNTAPPEVLSALFDGDALTVDEIIEHRREEPFTNSSQFEALVSDIISDEAELKELMKWIKFSSTYYTITSIGEHRGVRVKVTAVVHRSSRPDVLVQYYRIENVE